MTPNSVFHGIPPTYRRLISTVVCFVILLWHLRAVLYTSCTHLFLPFIWSQGSSDFLISPERDQFDLSFNNYSKFQATAGPDHVNHVPDILHHISLGTVPPHMEYQRNRGGCLDLHPGWETHLWTDENAAGFVAEKFPELKAIWDSYRHPVQKAEALKYLVLYEYDGVVLDMGLRCKRSLGPLRRFGFVAPAALPSGLSSRFMMASRQNTFLRALVRNLKFYNHDWFGLFSSAPTLTAGDQYCSLVHALQPNRAELRILVGPKPNFTLQSWSGMASTPLFDHVGTLWHWPKSPLLDLLDACIRWPFSALVFTFCVIFFGTHRVFDTLN